LKSQLCDSKAKRAATRSKIYGMTLMKNPASLWITLNFADTDDPIVQILAGEEIDMDHFFATAGPDRTQRAINTASNPFAAAQYFHMSVIMVLEELYGISVNRYHRITRQTGIFGCVAGYIGMVEAQGRGSLHLHLLLWLEGAPTSTQMQEMLGTESFRKKMCSFIRSAITAHQLSKDQRRAFGIIDRHLQQNLGGQNPEQLLMLMMGSGGVGKSKVIEMVTSLFQLRNCSHKLAKTALTGIAATNIEGYMLHWWGALP
ncbi:hypothetical protein JB92DRAFT_2583467, partial [Gautieria morchelliformis]